MLPIIVITFTLEIIASVFPGANSLQVRCVENGRFYRDPDQKDCTMYFLCLEGEVFEFKCSSGLYFDTERQICEHSQKVENCNQTSEPTPFQPSSNEEEDTECGNRNKTKCDDGVCLPKEYFCDGMIDCSDGSDEEDCSLDNDPNVATPCNTTTCHLPKCFCSNDGTAIPGRLNPTEVPQMIMLTFDDAINFENWDLFNSKIFTTNRRNPNGCLIKATFFVSHNSNNYHQTQTLWNDGHEIAVHSITHRGPEYWWSDNATVEEWFDEMIGQANIINKFAKVRMADINGVRVPFLSVGWNRQFLMMKEFGFTYDSSIVAPYSDPPLWPYTLDHKIPHACMGKEQNCPSHSYPGIWEMVVNQLSANKYTCAMVDSCPSVLNAEDAFRLLMYNFKRHYFSNRAPLGLYFHSTWFKNREFLLAFEKFVDEMMEYPDVWFVTNWQAIKWIQQPTMLKHLDSFTPWDCKKYFELSEEACVTPNVCKLKHRNFPKEQQLHTCTSCPTTYPWLKNEFGTNSY